MSVHDTIRQLLAIAEDQGASPAERELAMQRATTLMARHSITSINPQTTRTEEVTTRTITIPGGPTTASLALAYGIHAVATAAGASTYHTDRRRQRRSSDGRGPAVDVYLVGYPADLEWLTPLVSSLITHAALGWAAWRTDNPRRYRPMKPSTRQRVRNGYVRAYAAGVADRIRITRQDALDQLGKDERTSTALTVRTRTQRIQDHLDTLDLTPGRNICTDSRAAAQGRADGWVSGLGAPTHNAIDRS